MLRPSPHDIIWIVDPCDPMVAERWTSLLRSSLLLDFFHDFFNFTSEVRFFWRFPSSAILLYTLPPEITLFLQLDSKISYDSFESFFSFACSAEFCLQPLLQNLRVHIKSNTQNTHSTHNWDGYINNINNGYRMRSLRFTHRPVLQYCGIPPSTLPVNS